ncbi:MAG: RNA-binding S4 domain-containing protein [Pseudomonadota bacterium]
MASRHGDGPVRIDKWLWAARFFKTRRLATDAVSGGKVHVDGQRCKPSRPVRPGETLTIRKEAAAFTVEVVAVSDHRGPAARAEKLYRETPESVAARRESREARQLQPRPPTRPRGAGRPTKRERRQLDHWRGPEDGD